MIVFLLVSIVAAATADHCSQLEKAVLNGCEYGALKVTSVPSGILLNDGSCSSEYNKLEWQKQPKVEMKKADKEATYTLVMIDPDAINIGPGQSYLHWMVSNVKGADLAKGELGEHREIIKYRGPAPPLNTGKHRYIFLVFQEHILNQVVAGPVDRAKFDIVAWTKDQKQKLCGPNAGAHFITHH